MKKAKPKIITVPTPVPIRDEKCPNCGSCLVRYTEREEVGTRGSKTVYRDNVSYRCEKCKTEADPDVEADPSKIRKRKQLREEGFLTDIDIKGIRRKLGLTQEEMGTKLRVGVKNFARYESLRGHQGKSMDDLLRILDAYPEAIKVLEGLPKGKQK